MDDARQERLRGHLGRGLVASTLLHASALVPLVVTAVILGAEEEARRAEEVDVSFDDVDPASLPDDLPPIEPEPPSKKPKPASKKLADALPEPEQPPKPEEDKQDPAEVPPPPKPQERGHEKIVELDMGQDVEPPPDAKYLAEKNNRTDKETRDTRTNLERNVKEGGDHSSSPSDRKDRDPGDDKNKVAELEDQASQLGRQAPRTTPRLETSPGASETPDRKSPLAMRDLAPMVHEVTPETVDPSLPRDPNGQRSLPEQGFKADRAMSGPAGDRSSPRLRLSADDLDYLFGEEADAARALAQKERSRKAGRFTEKLERVRSSLENFIPEVTPGNQTALNTRAVPFARFIAQMHRSIHKVWGFGILEDLDRKSARDVMNQLHLAARLEIVLKPDGVIEKIGVVRSSGLVIFDAAAIDAVYSAGPFPEPPREIRSGNGKIYLRWTFHRDDRQCSPAFAEPYILENASPLRDREDTTVGLTTPRAPSQRSLERLRRDVPDSAAHRAKMAELDRAAGDTEDTDETASRQADAKVARADDPRARSTAEIFFDALARGEPRRAAGVVRFPLRAGNGVTIANVGELERQMAALHAELAASPKVHALTLYSSGGVRQVLGGVPESWSGDTTLLFAVARVGGDTFAAVMQPRQGTWRVVGLIRR